jgi:hypothetical protein
MAKFLDNFIECVINPTTPGFFGFLMVLPLPTLRKQRAEHHYPHQNCLKVMVNFEKPKIAIAVKSVNK